MLHYTSKVKHLRYVGNGSHNDVSEIGFIREVCGTQHLFPSLRQLEVECWPLTPSECSFLFCSTLETLTLVGPQPSMCKARSELQGPCPNGQYQNLCITKLVKQSPRLKTIHSLVLHKLEMPGQRDTLTVSVIREETIQITEGPKYRRPEWLDKVMNMEKFSNSHRFACRKYVDNNPNCPPLKEEKSLGPSSVLCLSLLIYVMRIGLNIEQVYFEFGMYSLNYVLKGSLISPYSSCGFPST